MPQGLPERGGVGCIGVLKLILNARKELFCEFGLRGGGRQWVSVGQAV